MGTEEQIWEREKALSRLGGDDELMGQLITLFLKNHQQKFDVIFQLLLSSDKINLSETERELLRQSAHAFKGNCLNIGATKLYCILLELEKNALTGSQTGLFKTAKQVETELPVLIGELKSYINKK